MLDRIRIIPHEAVPKCGSYEVRFPDGRPSRFYTGTTLPAGGSGQICSPAGKRSPMRGRLLEASRTRSRERKKHGPASTAMRVQVTRLHRYPISDLCRSVEVLQNTATDDAFELPRLACTGDEFNPPITGKAVRANDVGFHHVRSVRRLRITPD